jgi:hypothetical protein
MGPLLYAREHDLDRQLTRTCASAAPMSAANERRTLPARLRKNYRFALSPSSTTLALSPIATRRQMASERDSAATLSAHASTLAIISAGSRMPPSGSGPPMAGRPLFVFAFIDFFMPRLSVRIQRPNGGGLFEPHSPLNNRHWLNSFQ